MTKDAYIFINSDQSTCRLLVGFCDSCGIEKYHDGFFPPKKTNTSHPLGKNCGNHIIFNICALFSVGICELYSSPPQKSAIYLDIRIESFHQKKKIVLETHPILPRTLFWQVLPTPVVKLPSAQVAGCTTGICPEITPSLKEGRYWPSKYEAKDEYCIYRFKKT